MKLGIGTYTYMWSIGFDGARPDAPMTRLDLLRKALELGVKVVQYGPNLPLESAADPVVAAAKAAGIELEIGMKGLDPEQIRRQVQLARDVGATLLRTVPDYAGEFNPSEADLMEALEAVVPDLEGAGVRLAIENARIPARLLASVLNRLNSPWLGITLDTVNSLAIPEGTEEVTRTLAPHTLCLHVKDFSVSRAWHMMGFVVEGRPAGQGQLNIPWVLRILRELGRSPNVILELWPPQQGGIEATAALEQAWAVQSIGYLRSLILD